MKRLIQWSIDHHWMVTVGSLLLLAAGGWTARDMPVDVFPDLTAPTVTILTEGHGMAPDEMESARHVSDRDRHQRRVRRPARPLGDGRWASPSSGWSSTGAPTSSSARQIVAEKLSLVAGSLPPQVERPILAPISSIMGEILFFAISSDTRRSAGPCGRSPTRPCGGACSRCPASRR